MTEWVATFILGMGISMTFVVLHLPVPVTPTFAGFMGIAGLFVGYILGKAIL